MTPAADRPVENSELREGAISERGRDLIARYFQSVVAYHGETARDFEDVQSRAVAMGERDGDLAEYIASLEAEISRLRADRLTPEEVRALLAEDTSDPNYNGPAYSTGIAKLSRISGSGSQ